MNNNANTILSAYYTAAEGNAITSFAGAALLRSLFSRSAR